MLARSVAGYLAVGIIAGIVNLLARMLFDLAVSFELAVALAFPFGLTCAFLLNRAYVFEAGSEDARRQYAKFALVNLGALALVWSVSVGLYAVVFPAIGFTWNAEIIAHAIGVGSPVVLSFVAYRFFVFAGLKDRKPDMH
ncbi:MAG: GtrA family protein [Pseudomonadota bacterium]